MPGTVAGCRRASTRTSCSTRGGARSTTCSPGFEEDLIAAGGLHLMASMDTAYLEGPGWTPRKQGALDMVYGSRILIERVLRDKVRQLPNVTIREGASVNGIDTTGGGTPQGRVTGVRFTTPDGDEQIAADLVVDAMGRGSSVSDWLVAAGWPETPVKTLDAKVTYVSRWYDLPSSGGALRRPGGGSTW